MRNPHQILTRIAEALGVPVETFSSGSFVAHDCEMLSELIALWFRVTWVQSKFLGCVCAT